MPPTSTVPEAAPFEIEVKSAVLGLRARLGAIVGKHVSPLFQPIELHKRLGIDRRLGWSISRLLQDEDLLEAALHYPGQAAIRRFLSKAGCDEVAREGVLHAVDAFERMVSRHAGDQATFESLIAASASTDLARTRELEQRQAAFSANGYIYGVRARLQLALYVLAPHADGETIDVAVVRGYVGMHRLSPNRSWPIMARRWASEDGTPSGSARFCALDPREEADATAAPLLREFCSPTDMRIEAVQLPGGIREYRLPPAGVGLGQSQVCVIGERVVQAGPRFGTREDPALTLSPAIRTPVEALLFDCIVHDELAQEMAAPELMLTSDVNRLAGQVAPVEERDRLESLGAVRHLGVASAAAVREHRYEQYGAMVEAVLGTLGADRQRYQLHRAWLPFPPLASTANVTFGLPSRRGEERGIEG
ncbi:MAG: hypothetical protein AAGG07_13220 [Planctomycetota bacterium]